MASDDTLRVCVTGAAGLIGYSLVPMIAAGQMFGPNQKVSLALLDINMEFAIKGLNGLVMELEDCVYPLVQGVIGTTDPAVAFKDADYCIMCGAFPRKPGMERKDLLEKNAGIFREQGVAIKENAKKTVKCLVVGNPANTNAYLLRHYGDLPAKNVTALTRLDMNRARNMIGRRVGVPGHMVRNVNIWGNHSATQYADVNNATVQRADGALASVREAVNDDDYLNTTFVTDIQQRGAKVIQTRGSSSATSAARGIVDHMRDWHCGTQGEFVSMGVYSTGNPYGIADDLMYSFPCTCEGGEWSIVSGLAVDDFSQSLMKKTEAELLEERATALEITRA